MAQYWLDLTRPEAEILNEFTFLQRSGSGTLSIVNDAGTPALRLGYQGGTSHLSAVWNVVGSSADTDVVAHLTRSGSFNFPVGITSRWNAESATGFNGYSHSQRLGSSETTLAHINDLGTGFSSLGSTSVADPLNTYFWVRLQTVGTTVRSKAWDGGRDNEPSEWDVSVTDTAHASGGVGLYQRGRAADPSRQNIAVLAIGTDGDPAPTGPVGPGPSGRRRSPLLLTPW